MRYEDNDGNDEILSTTPLRHQLYGMRNILSIDEPVLIIPKTSEARSFDDVVKHLALHQSEPSSNTSSIHLQQHQSINHNKQATHTPSQTISSLNFPHSP